MKYILTYNQFLLEKESSFYKVPYAAIKPALGDKIWWYIKGKINHSPLWGIDQKKQDKLNQIKRD